MLTSAAMDVPVTLPVLTDAVTLCAAAR
jgi:hypothetical protein